MPAGLTALPLPQEARREIDAAADLLASRPERWRVLYHNDGDGVGSASVAAWTFQRMGRRFQLTPLVTLERTALEGLLAKTPGPVLVLDTGMSLLEPLARHPHPVVVLDHHKPVGPIPASDRFVVANPHHWGTDGMTEMSASMLTYLFALRLDAANGDLIGWGLSGAIADRQHVGGFQGLNLKLVEEAEARGELQRKPGLALVGPSLEEALVHAIDPYFKGLSGRSGPVKAFLTDLGLSPRLPPGSLSPTEVTKLSSALVCRLMDQGTRPEFCERVIEERITLRSGADAHELSVLQNATAREGEAGVGVALALGDARATVRARELEAAWRRQLLEGLRALEAPSGVHVQGSLQWFETPAASLGGTLAGTALTYFLDPLRPIFALSPAGDRVKISSRGTLWLTGQGLDLATVCREAASRVGGEGGGHMVASGGSIPRGREADFLKVAETTIAGQITGLKGPRH